MVDRIRRALADVSDRVSSVVEPISTGLGKAFGVADWAVEMFAEEVVRGGPAFALSLVGFLGWQSCVCAHRNSAASQQRAPLVVCGFCRRGCAAAPPLRCLWRALGGTDCPHDGGAHRVQQKLQHIFQLMSVEQLTSSIIADAAEPNCQDSCH